MRDWHQRRRTDCTLRLGGLSLCGLSFLAIRALVQSRPAALSASPGVAAFVLAAAGFLCASVGAALLTLGRHIFDEIDVAQRWRRRAPPPERRDRSDVAPPHRAAEPAAPDPIVIAFRNQGATRWSRI